MRLALTNNFLTGSIPVEMGNLLQLKSLLLHFNTLQGTIPNIFTGMEKLEIIALAGNNLSGEIPASIWHPNTNVILLQSNNITGSVPDIACESLSTLKVDNSPWFVDEAKVECPCCENSPSSFRIINNATRTESIRPMCPSSNIRKLHFKEAYWIKDQIPNETIEEFIGVNSEETVEFCFSPSGCYSTYEKVFGSLKHNLKYNHESKSLKEQNDCGAVEVCGESFDQHHEKRNALNHLTQTFERALVENTVENKALCSILVDPHFNEYHVHDGTLLQRYASLHVFFSGPEEPTKEMLDSLVCHQDFLNCDANNRYIEEMNLQKWNLTGKIPVAIRFLTRLRTINLSYNKLDGTLDPNLFSNMPFLEQIRFEENEIGGTFPNALFELPNLKTLNLANNAFTGSLPQLDSYSKNLGECHF